MNAFLEFLDRLHPDSPRTLTVFKPKPNGVTLAASECSRAKEWVETRDGSSDIYFLLGLAEGKPNGQPKKEQMRGSCWLWADLDPRAGEDIEEERGRILGRLTDDLPDDVPPPTIIVDSGRGYWGLWQLDEPCLDLAKVEAANRALARAFGAIGDSCWNINRVGRLPGTVNLKTGDRATVVADDPTRVYSIDQFPTVPATTVTLQPSLQTGDGLAIGDPSPISDLAELDQWGVPDRVKVIIAQGGHPDEPPKEGKDTTRSGWLWDASCQLRRCGVPDEIMLGIITDPQWAISAHILDQPNPLKAAQRLILRTKDTVDAEVTEFEMNKDGVPYPNQHNIRVALRKLGVRLSHDQFADRLLVDGFSGHGPVLQDEDIAAIYLLIDERFKFRPGKDFFWMVLEDEARRNGFHPVREYLDGLAWDGQPRIDKWLTRYGGAEDNLYVQAVGALVLMAAVRRIRKPGCKFDEMLVLRSPQGSLKSTALQTLVPNSDWFTDDLPLGADTKVVIERLHGRWIVEAAELQGMRRGDVEHLKAFLSRQFDRARMAYGRITKEVLRQCVIVGTTNSERFLKDMTGNRRFWPVQVEKFDLDALRRDRDQLWAEAAHREVAGASIRLDPALYPAAAEAQESHLIEDPFVGRLVDVLGNMEGKLKAQDAFEIVGVPYGQRTQDHNSRLGEAMRELGWERTKLRFDGVPQWAYVRGDRSKRIELHRDGNGNLEIRPSGFKELF